MVLWAEMNGGAVTQGVPGRGVFRRIDGPWILYERAEVAL